MVRNGYMTGVYLQLDLKEKVDKIVENRKDLFKSRNHFINCCIVRELRRFENG